MPLDISCPGCGETDRIRGERSGDDIALTCDACGTAWSRDPSPRCASCGGDDVVAAPKAVVEKVRGDQMSVVGTVTVHLCRSCDAALIDTHTRSGAPLPPDTLPVNSRHGWMRERDDDVSDPPPAG